MNLKNRLKTNFPFFYECYNFAKWELKRPQNRKKQMDFYKMTDQQYRDMCARQYKEYTGRTLNWDHLETFSEKTQWAKLYDQDSRKSVLADKYAVRSWVAERIGEEYLIPIYGTWERYKDIEWDKLPAKFVLKTNHGSGNVVIVRNKEKRTLRERMESYRKINQAMDTDFGTMLCEMHYSKIPRKIIAEKLMGNGEEEIPDYKFLCFDGNPVCCWVDRDRFVHHCRDFYDLDWNKLPWKETHPFYEKGNPKPKNYEKMIELAKKLSAGFPFVRVDLYNLDGEIYFGEMTFTSVSGYEIIEPDEVDKKLGELWHLDMQQRR